MTAEKTINRTVMILPNPKNADVHALVQFSDKDTKESYIKKEYNYCKEQYRVYWGAMTVDERATAFAKVSAARVAFAHSMGYHPQKADPFTWIFQGTKNPQQPTVA